MRVRFLFLAQEVMMDGRPFKPGFYTCIVQWYAPWESKKRPWRKKKAIAEVMKGLGPGQLVVRVHGVESVLSFEKIESGECQVKIVEWGRRVDG
jgi:hypothetical protein